MDRNEVKITGLAITDPIYTKMQGSNTPLASFLLQTNEQFYSHGKNVYHSNIINIESLGKNASAVMEKVSKGSRFEITGYLRSEQGKFSVRAFVVNKENRDNSLHYAQGIEISLETLMTSKDKEAAIDALRKLLHEVKSA